jgi:hypothetical protein
MSSVGAALRIPRPRIDIDGTARATIALCALAALAAVSGATAPASLRLVFFIAIVTALVPLCLMMPRAGVLATLSFLVVVALIRRLLIPVSPWSSFDPLLLVGPCIAVVVLIKLFLLERRPLASDPLSKLVLAVLFLTVLQVGNPAGGGVGGGLAGFLFIGIPLLWFFIGRELASEAFVRNVLTVVLWAGLVAGAYGLYQLAFGFPSWDKQWTQFAEVHDLQSLNVGGITRAFGTFSSFLEYALVLATALVVSAGMLMRGRVYPILAVPLLAVALFLSSSRGPLVTAAFAIIVLLAIRPRRPRVAVIVVLIGLVGAFGVLKLIGGGGGGGSALVAHQVEGLSDPLNSNNSTLLIHISLVVDGVKHSIHHPLGSGTGATNQAGSKLGAGGEGTAPTEVDVSNEFVDLGPLGGVLYLCVVLLTLWQAIRLYFAGQELLLPVIGVLVVGLGQWLSGGHWFLAPATWVFAGIVAAVWQREREAATPAVASAPAPVHPPTLRLVS